MSQRRTQRPSQDYFVRAYPAGHFRTLPFIAASTLVIIVHVSILRYPLNRFVHQTPLLRLSARLCHLAPTAKAAVLS